MVQKNSTYSSPFTGLDWNELHPDLIATSSIDSTCEFTSDLTYTTLKSPTFRYGVEY